MKMNLLESSVGWFLTFATLFGNGHVMYLITSKPQLHISTNWFVLSLAVADICVGLCYFPVLFLCESTAVPCSTVFERAFQWTLLFLSTSNLCAMSVDRYLAVVKPLKYLHFMTDKSVLCLVVLAWSFPILTFTVPFVIINTGHNLSAQRLYGYYPFLFLQILPCITLFVVFIRVCVIARRQARRTAVQFIQVGFNHTVRSLRDSKQGSSIHWFGILLAFFVASHVVKDFSTVCSKITISLCSSNSGSVITKLGHILIIANSAINPLVYGFLKGDIKRFMRRSFPSMISATGDRKKSQRHITSNAKREVETM